LYKPVTVDNETHTPTVKSEVFTAVKFQVEVF